MADESDRVARGRRAFASQLRLPEDEAVAALERMVGEQMATEAIYAAGGAWVEDALSLRERGLVVLTALVAQGGVPDRLRTHTRWALDNGLTPDELEALATFLAVYVGYPRASVAIEVIRDVVATEAAADESAGS